MKRLSVHVLFGVFGVCEITNANYSTNCPDRSQWRINAKEKCNNTEEYHCLYNQVDEEYIELCRPAKEFVKGRKVVYAGTNFDVPRCAASTFMPVNVISNMGHECVLQKSICSEEGQLLYENRSTAQDSVCICNFLNGYANVNDNLSNLCYCNPSEEDCSCYKKPFPDDNPLISAGDKCILKNETVDGIQRKIPIIRCDTLYNSTTNLPFIKEIITEDLSVQDRILQILTDSRNMVLVFICLIIFCLVVMIIGLIFVYRQKQKFGAVELEKEPDKVNETLCINIKRQQTNTTECNTEKRYLEVEGIIRIKVESAQLRCHLHGENLKSDDCKKEPRILDMCFIKKRKQLYLLYIDADNIENSIVTRQIRGDKSPQDSCRNISLVKHPNRLAKLGDDVIALIYKDDFNILTFKFIFDEMKLEDGPSYNLNKKQKSIIGEKGIQGIAGISEKLFILSNRSELFQFKIHEGNVEMTNLSIKDPFDTARRLSVTTGTDTRVFIADENDKKIVCIDSEGVIKGTRKSHDRALQNVRSIASTDDKLFAATSEGVCVFNHTKGKFENTDKNEKDPYRYSPILVEYLKHVSHARSLCLEVFENEIYLGLSFVIDRKDHIIVFSVDKSNISNFNSISK
ncbi:uncharacterized protein LOC127732615 isoform X2 [Mytilus californianus]|uniref:uncharacterized protein LOC127732615 isoform X2 n=1 Tax=Mytilus californianus TaxID=6549 RepID=UPI002247F935|nr:uncharacterized protein LOC127732615 isoform X2 [Mytilus californianus]